MRHVFPNGSRWLAGAIPLLLAAAAAASPADLPVPSDALASSFELSIASEGRRRIDFDVHRPPGRLVDIGTHRLHLFCIGSGAETVVLDAGLGGFSLEWLKVQSDLAAETRVCSYDRAGYGWSDPGPQPRTSARIVDELRRLLDAAGEQPPFVLVGHSFGGYTTQLFAKQYPDAVAGLVLVDSSHPAQADRLPQREQTRVARGYRRRMMSWPVVPPNFPFAARSLAYYLMHRPAAIRAQRLELNSFTLSGRQVALAGQLPRVPVAVVSRGARVWPENAFGDEMEAKWRELQDELATPGATVRRFEAPFSGHYVHLDQPWLVEDAIRGVIDDARAGGAFDTALSE